MDYLLGTYTAEKNIFSWGGVHDAIHLFLLESEPVYLAAFNNTGWKQWVETNQPHSEGSTR